MHTKQTWKIIGTIALVIAVTIGVSLYTNRAQAPVTTAPQEQSANISLTIHGLYTNKQISISENESVLQTLEALNTQDPQLALSTKEYSGLGTLVDSMHGMKNGTNKNYWQYKVNGVMPQIGADAYKLKSGDSVEWFFGASQE